MIRTYQYRVKDSACSKTLSRHARAVNGIWNFCNATQKHALKWNKKWPSSFDLSNLCAGSSKELGLHSQTVQAVCETYGARKSEKKRSYLRYRGKKHTGWIPFKASAIKAKSNGFAYGGKLYKVWMSRTLLKAVAHGAIVVEVNEAHSTVTCSCCESRTGPEGVAGLRIREWTCRACGQQHDRDTNAARNILRLGHQTLAAGIPSL